MAQNYRDDANNYLLGNDTGIWIGTQLLTKESPSLTKYSIQAVGSNTALATTQNLAIWQVIPGRIADGLPLKSVTGQVFLARALDTAPIDPIFKTAFVPPANTPAAEISLPIYPRVAPVDYNVSGTPASVLLSYEDRLLLQSVNEATYSVDGSTVVFRDFKASVFEYERSIKKKISFSTSGYYLIDDPIVDLLRTCSETNDSFVNILYIMPGGKSWEFNASVKKDDSRSTKMDEAVMAKFEFTVQSRPLYANLKPS